MEGTTVAEYFWHFGFSGEGNWSEEAEPDPIVYNQAGEYTVTLTAWGADGNRATVKKVVTVLADNVVPTADFSYSPMMVNVGNEVTFTDKSTDSDGEIVSREWVFPDGSTSTETNPSYTFTQKGMFQVKLTVADDRGGESSATKSINVRDGDVSDFALLWSTEVASADALCDANVVTVERSGLCLCRDPRRLAGNWWRSTPRVLWRGNTMPPRRTRSICQKGDRLPVGRCRRYGLRGWRTPTATIRPSRPSMRSRVRRAPCSGRTSRPTPQAPASPSRRRVSARTWSSSAAGARTARCADSRRSSGRNTAQATPANGGGTSGTIVLKNGVVIFTNTGEYGYGIMVPDDQFVWSPVPTADTFAPGKTLSAGRCQPCVGADNCVYLPGKIKEGSGGSWNIACFDCTNLTASSTKTPKWSVAVPDGFVQGGASLSADGQTLYIVADAATPSTVYALSTSNGSTVWSYPLDAHCNSVPAVDNLGQVHVATETGHYVVLSPDGKPVYDERDRRHVRGFGLDLRVGLLLRAGQGRFGGQAQGLRGGAAGRKLRRGVGLVAVHGRNARHINYQQ